MLKIIYIYIYISSDNRTFNNTNNIYQHINQYSIYVVNNYKIHKTHSVKKTYYKFTNGAIINKHNTINTNNTYNICKTNNVLDITDNQYF